MRNPFAGLFIGALIIGGAASYSKGSFAPLAVAVVAAIMLKPFLPPD